MLQNLFYLFSFFTKSDIGFWYSETEAVEHWSQYAVAPINVFPSIHFFLLQNISFRKQRTSLGILPTQWNRSCYRRTQEISPLYLLGAQNQKYQRRTEHLMCNLQIFYIGPTSKFQKFTTGEMRALSLQRSPSVFFKVADHLSCASINFQWPLLYLHLILNTNSKVTKRYNAPLLLWAHRLEYSLTGPLNKDKLVQTSNMYL